MIEFRKMKIEDSIILTNLRKEIWNTTYRNIMEDSMIDDYNFEKYNKMDMENIKNSDIFSYLIYRDEKAIGFLIFSINNKDYSDFQVLLNAIYIVNEEQGKGIGREAFKIVRDFCDINDYTKFYCICNYWNRDSIEFYKNMGGIISKEELDNERKIDDIVYFEFVI